MCRNLRIKHTSHIQNAETKALVRIHTRRALPCVSLSASDLVGHPLFHMNPLLRHGHGSILGCGPKSTLGSAPGSAPGADHSFNLLEAFRKIRRDLDGAWPRSILTRGDSISRKTTFQCMQKWGTKTPSSLREACFTLDASRACAAFALKSEDTASLVGWFSGPFASHNDAICDTSGVKQTLHLWPHLTKFCSNECWKCGPQTTAHFLASWTHVVELLLRETTSTQPMHIYPCPFAFGILSGNDIEKRTWSHGKKPFQFVCTLQGFPVD